MKQILMSELEIGDIYCNQVRLQGREAFEVLGVLNDSVTIISRKKPKDKPTKKTMKGYVILLKRS